MEQEFAIQVENVSKAYKIYENPTDRIKQVFTKNNLYKEFWALKNVSLNISKGSVVGIVGRNGSGKSTLLQIIAGTLKPTEGYCRTNGKIAALLELGSGFNPEFTGRENVYVCGSIYGISKESMDGRMNAIEAFADIGAFIDQPVKTYSSGMFARLAFAVNINVDADILIVDEVLSVGDHFFQAKCISAINRLMKKGITILMVSHSQATIKALCESAILFNKGNLIMQGGCDEVMDRYMAISLSEEITAQTSEAVSIALRTSQEDTNKIPAFQSQLLPPFKKRVTERFGEQALSFTEAALYQFGTETTVLEAKNQATLSLWIQANENIENDTEVGVVVRTFEGIDLFAMNSFFCSQKIPHLSKGFRLRVNMDFEVLLGPGKYSVTAGLRTPIQGAYQDKAFNAIIFDVVNMTNKTIPLLFDVPFKMRIEEVNL